MTRALAAALLLLPLAAAGQEARRVVVSEDFTAVLHADQIRVEARPIEGETPQEFARRLARDPDAAARLLAGPELPGAGRPVTVPYAALSNEARFAAVRALFPSDVRATAGWIHIAVAAEPLAAIADWFTGSPANAPALARVNLGAGEVVPRGTVVKIPTELLAKPFIGAEPVPDSEPPRLEFGEDEKGKFALYRLRKGEALYSGVVVRFTGRIHASDVIELALRLAERSGIEDVHAIPVGFPVKIPVAYLTAEYLPKGDPKAVALEKEKAEVAQFARPVKARGLSGVRVVLDAGHGGRDTGTLHHGVWESTYVYDVTARLRRVLLETTHAEVVMTSKEPGLGWDVPDRDRLPDRKTRMLLTEPPYALADPTAGVNLRCYLATSVLRKPGPDRRPVPAEKTVFLSIHADSLHPSVRGAMVYVPGQRFLKERYAKTAPFYLAYREVRDEPVVAFSRKERVLSEGVSTSLAEKLISSIRRRGLPVHQFSPVRTHVIRGGREWVPAVLRYNRIPNRVLVEISNLANDADRASTLTRAFRQQMAEALAEGLVAFFGGPDVGGPDHGRTSAAASAVSQPVAEVAVAAEEAELPGPWPEVAGPWPQAHGPSLPPVQGPPAPRRRSAGDPRT